MMQPNGVQSFLQDLNKIKPHINEKGYPRAIEQLNVCMAVLFQVHEIIEINGPDRIAFGVALS